MLNNYSINDCPYAQLCLLSFKLQLYREVCLCNTVLASHIDTTALANGTYELIPESEEGDQGTQLNAAVLTEDPDQSPEEPKADLVSDYREGKLRT